MTDRSSTTETELDEEPTEHIDERRTRDGTGLSDERTTEDDVPQIDDGRYIYCVVLTEEDEMETDTLPLETTGVEGEPVSVVTVDGVGAVVHECDDIYDSADLTRIRRWLVRHQTVVDEAGEAFGTPLPFQFDTILRGDDEDVHEWLRSEYDSLRGALESLADHWEYRIEVVRTDSIDDAALEASDDQLAAVRRQINDATDGAAFLHEKRYERRLAAVRDARREATTADLCERLAEHAREVHELERSPATTLESGSGSGSKSGSTDDTTGTDDAEIICRLTVLVHEDDEDSIGAVLDKVAAQDGLEVRFTGPWPPYTFAPSFGDDETNGESTHGSQSDAPSTASDP